MIWLVLSFLMMKFTSFLQSTENNGRLLLFVLVIMNGRLCRITFVSEVTLSSTIFNALIQGELTIDTEPFTLGRFWILFCQQHVTTAEGARTGGGTVCSLLGEADLCGQGLVVAAEGA